MNIDDIIPYEDNARYNEEAIPEVAKSIEEFGLRGQIVLETRDNPVIVAGHTRWAACKSLGWTEIPDEKIDYCGDLTPDQIMAYRLADNRTGEIAKWNKALLKREVRKLEARGIDMSKYRFDFKSKVRPYGAEKLRTDKAWNLDLTNMKHCAGEYDMPTLAPVDVRPSKLVPFNYCKTATSYEGYVHFCIDDYQFERVWAQPMRYLELLSRFDGLIAPDFSLYFDMPLPMRLWNLYRSSALASWWTRQGLTVVPILHWADRDSLRYCFEGIPKHSTLFKATVGAQIDAGDSCFFEGMEMAINICKPNRILLYGHDPGINFHDVEVVKYKPNTAFQTEGEKHGSEEEDK